MLKREMNDYFRERATNEKWYFIRNNTEEIRSCTGDASEKVGRQEV